MSDQYEIPQYQLPQEAEEPATNDYAGYDSDELLPAEDELPED